MAITVQIVVAFMPPPPSQPAGGSSRRLPDTPIRVRYFASRAPPLECGQSVGDGIDAQRGAAGSKTQKKSRPKAALNSKLMIVDRATTNAGFDFRGQP
jgi:hypothetical protein